jgi:uncharacterized phage protein gp47/JayE
MADEIKYGLSEAGFRRKRMPEIISDMSKRISDRLGVTIQTGSNSIFGQLIGVFSYELADLWEQLENAYDAAYPNTATGVALSNAAATAGIRPLSGEYSSLEAACYGNDGTAIPAGALITGKNSNIAWSCVTTGEISSRKCYCVSYTITEAVKKGNYYEITINGSNVNYTAQDGDTPAAVLGALKTKIAAMGLAPAMDENILTIKDDTGSMSVSSRGLETSELGSLLTFRCTTPGAIDPSPMSVTQIITSTPGWKSVRNELETAVGRNNESDTELRQRWSRSLYARAYSMTDAIAAAIYEDVPGVKAVTCDENFEDVTDDMGRPPHCVEAVVDGGDAEKIADVIWKRKAGGIDTYGNSSATIQDSEGVERTVKFSRPELVNVWIKITVTSKNGATISKTTLQNIRDAVLSASTVYTLGDNIVLQRFYAAIYSESNDIASATITAATGTTAGTYSANNITINARQIAVFSADRIEVSAS